MSLARAVLPPGVIVLLGLAGCIASVSQPTALPERNTLVRDQLVIHSDFSLPSRHRLVEELAALRGDVSSRLGLPTSDESIHVYLFDSSERYSRFMDEHYPAFPIRRAFFVESDTRLAVYAHWGDRVAEDVRHETAHGYLHSVVPTIPLWLDEGLAEYFEVPRGSSGLHLHHLATLHRRMASGQWQPNLERLESLSAVGDMTQIDYAEAWAWAHWLVDSEPRRRDLLRAYLEVVRRAGSAVPLSVRLKELEPTADAALAGHVKGLAGQLGMTGGEGSGLDVGGGQAARL